MPAIHIEKDTQEKLEILSRDAQYDLACACGTKGADQRKRNAEGNWIYPTTMADGRKTMLFKTLLSNVCTSDCLYCPLRKDQDPERCAIAPSKMADTFLEYLRQRRVSGLFLSSGILGDADTTMERLNATARRVRRSGFRGYLHLKMIPGASRAAIEDSLSLASTVSLNIEVPGEEHFQRLCRTKRYVEDVIRPMQWIRELTDRGARYEGIKQTTQFVVGASKEVDRDIVRYTGAAYERLHLHRVYFSAYQEMTPNHENEGDVQQVRHENHQRLTREHRLYQVDYLLRTYGFDKDEIPFDEEGNLDLRTDPKEMWARRHPEFFPVNLHRAEKEELLRVPGLGPVTVKRILKLRKNGGRIQRLSDIGKVGALLKKAEPYLKF